MTPPYPAYIKIDSPQQGPVVFMLPAKCASNSIKAALRHHVGPDNLPYVTRDEVLRNGQLTIAVVRHPLTRLVSCWRDKIMHNWMPELEQCWMRPGMRFAEFLGLVLAISDVHSNRHFRSYSDELLLAGTKPSFVLRTELLKQNWAELETYLGWENHVELTHLNSSRCEPPVTLSRSQIAAIEFRYQTDLATFGYSMTEWPDDQEISYDFDSD